MTRHRWREQLETHLPPDLPDRAEVADRVVAYLELLDKWNRAFNLTGVRDRAQWVSRHILDSLTLLPWLDRGPVLDVGSGAGLPGIPLAIARPRLPFTLLDSNSKKTRFLVQARAELGLDNVDVRHARVETLAGGDYAVVTSRAFASLAELVGATRHLLAPDGVWLALKAAVIDAELDALPPDLAYRLHAVQVPGAPDRQCRIVRLSPAPDTSG